VGTASFQPSRTIVRGAAPPRTCDGLSASLIDGARTSIAADPLAGSRLAPGKRQSCSYQLARRLKRAPQDRGLCVSSVRVPSAFPEARHVTVPLVFRPEATYYPGAILEKLRAIAGSDRDGRDDCCSTIFDRSAGGLRRAWSDALASPGYVRIRIGGCRE
jgi:hypothetical protein